MFLKNCKALLVFLIVVLFFIFTNTVLAATIYSNSSTGNDATGNGSSGSPYKTFYKAYTQAVDNDTIDLTGTFTWSDADELGDASSRGYRITKDLTITGHGPDNTIIQSASSENTSDRRVFTINASSTTIIENLTIRYGKINSSYGCGILVNDGGNVKVDNCDLYGNRCDGGGGLANDGVSEIINSSIHDNTVTYMGGGLLNEHVATGDLTITNCTIYNNTVTRTSGYHSGGGIHHRGNTNTYLTNSTVYDNYSKSYGGISIESRTSGQGHFYVKNSIISNNRADGTSGKDVYESRDNGAIHDNGYNIVGSVYRATFSSAGTWTDTDGDDTFTLNSVGTTGTINFDSGAGPNDVFNKPYTYGILANSIAINNGSSSANESVSIPSTDQRGATRSGATDIGAFEYNGGGISITEPSTQDINITFSSVEYKSMTISWTKGNGSKRVVFMKQASTGTALPVDSTTYTANTVFGSGTQIGSTGWYAIYNGTGTSVDVTGITKATDYIVQVFEYNGVTHGHENYNTNTATNNPATQSSYAPVTIYINSSTGNDTTGNGSSGAPYKTFHKAYTEAHNGDTIDLTGTFTWSDADELGDVSAHGYQIVKDLIIKGHGPDNTIIQSASSENTSDRRVFTINASSTTTIENLTIRYGETNSSYGCGILVNDGGNVKVDNCDLYGNRCYGGGGLANDGISEIINSSIHDNTVTHMGGGLLNEYAATGDLTITNCTIYNNTVTRTYGYYSGGGIHHRGDTNTYLTNSTVYDNYSHAYGGISIASKTSGQGHFYVKNSIISNNRAHYSSGRDVSEHRTNGIMHDNGYNIVGYLYHRAFSSAGTWTDTDGDDTFTLNSVGTTGTINFDSSAAINSNPYKTKTYALLANSIAINNGSSSANESVSIPSTDQRGAARSGTTDIGAFEYDGAFDVPIVLSFSPVDGATNVNVTDNLIITFNENIYAKSGNIKLYKSDNTLIETFDVTSDISGSGTDTITINPSSNLSELVSYYIKIDATAFDDVDDNSYAGIQNTTTWNFTTIDETLPTITSVSSDTVDGFYKVGDIIDIDVVFSEAVTSTGNVTVTLETGDTDRTCTFTISSSTTGTCNYTVQSGDSSNDLNATISGTIKDSANNILTNFTPATSLENNKNLVIDTVAPTAILLPADNTLNVSILDNLVITFSEIVDVESGNIVIYKASDNSIIETIDITGSLVTGTGTSTITVNPTSNLNYKTEYYVLINATAIDDRSSNSYAGITNTTDWSFTTENTPRCPVISNAATYNSYPNCGVATCNDGYLLVSRSCKPANNVVALTPRSVGTGSVDIAIPMKASRSVNNVSTAKGANVMMHIHSVASFDTLPSHSSSLQKHTVEIIDLNMLTGKVKLRISSEPQIVELSIGDLMDVDLDNDGVKDIELIYNKLFVNMVDLTIKQLDSNTNNAFKLNNNLTGINIGVGFYKPKTKLFADNQAVHYKNDTLKRNINKTVHNNTNKTVLPNKNKSAHNNSLTNTNNLKQPKKTEYNFVIDLHLGIKHPSVKKLQHYLNTNGFTVTKSGLGSLGQETDFFGQLTKSALIKFQKAKNINPAWGYFGPITRKYIK